MLKYRKYIILFLIVVSIISFIWGAKIILNEEKFIYVNSENKETIKDALKDAGISTIGIKKIGIGQGWHRHSLYIHYYIGATEELHIGEGTTYKIPVEPKSMDKEALIACGISITTLIAISVYEIKK